MNTIPATPNPHRAQRLIGLATTAVVLVLIVLTAACGNDDTVASPSDDTVPTTVDAPAETPSDDTVPTTVDAPAEGDQWELIARIKEIHTASASLEYDELEILTGEEARQAAIDAGAIQPDEDLPNDAWLRNDSEVTERATVDPQAAVWIYDCTAGCDRVQVGLDAFLRRETQAYGGEDAVWEITLTDGVITSLLEVYLP